MAEESLPPRGAWIEITVQKMEAAGMESLPPRGAWIEIKTSIACIHVLPRVAPPAGSVD